VATYRRWATVLTIATCALLATALTWQAQPAAAQTPQIQASQSQNSSTRYYVVLGDSLASGWVTSSFQYQYAEQVYNHERQRIGHLVMVRFSCPGATTSIMLNGGGWCNYSTGTQVGDAQDFLRAHPGQIAFASIDIGVNDILGCTSKTAVDQACIHDGTNAVSANLPTIISDLRSADPGLTLYGMNYYDPFLAYWLDGPTGQAVAQASVLTMDSFNAQLAKLYTDAGAYVADAAAIFQTDDYANTGTYNGVSIPQNVERICQWTQMCPNQDIHTNNSGHTQLALSFDKAIDVSTPITAGQGYYEVASDGRIYPFGDAVNYGSMGGFQLNSPIVAAAVTPGAQGYYEIASDGGIFAFGSATFRGSMGGTKLNSPIVAGTVTQSGQGYYEVASDGGVFSFGDAAYYGSMGGSHLNSPIVGLAATPDGLGYWLVASDGGVFSFGDAAYYGSMGGSHLNSPIVGLAATTDGLGYQMVASDGGIFSFGDASFYGSMGGSHLNSPIAASMTTPTGHGYYEVASDGGVFSFGDAVYYGSMGGSHLSAPVVAIQRGD
jgi:ribosomal protein L24E